MDSCVRCGESALQAVRPVLQEVRPVLQEVRPVLQEVRPVLQEVRPVLQEVRPVLQEGFPPQATGEPEGVSLRRQLANPKGFPSAGNWRTRRGFPPQATGVSAKRRLLHVRSVSVPPTEELTLTPLACRRHRTYPFAVRRGVSHRGFPRPGDCEPVPLSEELR